MPADIGPASHHPAPHYMAEEFDPDHMFRDLLNQAKDINPEAFAKHYHAAVRDIASYCAALDILQETN